MTNDFFDLGVIEPPDYWPKSGVSTKDYIVSGLQAAIKKQISFKLGFRFENKDYVEIRIPHTRIDSEIDYWHQDRMATPTGSIVNFWLILWNSAPMTEMIRLAQSSSSHNRLPLTLEAPPGERITVRENAIILFRNDRFAHRRPPITVDESTNRWFARFFPQKQSHEFNECVEAYIKRQVEPIEPFLPYRSSLKNLALQEPITYREKEEWLKAAQPTFKFQHIY